MKRRNFLKATGLIVAAGTVLPKVAKSMFNNSSMQEKNFSLEVITGNSEFAIKLIEDFAKSGQLGTGSFSYSEHPVLGDVMGDLIFVKENSLIDYTQKYDEVSSRLKEIRNKLNLPAILNNPVRLRLFRNSGKDVKNIFIVQRGNIISKINPEESGSYTFTGKSGNLILDVNRYYAKVQDSQCKHKICKQMSSIKMPGDYITCIPNELHIFAE